MNWGTASGGAEAARALRVRRADAASSESVRPAWRPRQQCHRLCLFSAETLTNVLDFKRDAGLWHAVLTVSAGRGGAGPWGLLPCVSGPAPHLPRTCCSRTVLDGP